MTPGAYAARLVPLLDRSACGSSWSPDDSSRAIPVSSSPASNS